MTPRTELYIKIKEVLKTIPALEYVALFRNQLSNPERFPDLWTAALIKINAIEYTTMTEENQEGNCSVEIYLYTKDGFTDQHATTEDSDEGLIELELLDSITEKLQFLKGDYFKPLKQSTDEALDQELDGIMSYVLRFDTQIYRSVNKNYHQNKKIKIIA
ncbi:hypothetical protein QP547_04630 [Weeksella virosa]|uniref:hypothetical protein n=1 Tax=Weeksella virosa TaxID=1014 RepID=UPI002552E1FB|nr:hypothetical protein [Weeksella virosa]MDK7675095.1 hypothetical protein [Weeksella virosa]